MTDTSWERIKAILDAGAVPADVGPAPCRLILHLPPEAPAGDRLQRTQVDDLVRDQPEGPPVSEGRS